MDTPSTGKTDPEVRYGLTALFACTWLICIGQLTGDYLSGGHEYRQGDWLINSLNTPVRRALTGNILIRISDATNLSPLSWLIILQSMLISAVLALLFIELRKLPGRLSLLLALSAGLPAMFWALAPTSAPRKELLAFLFLLLLLRSLQQSAFPRTLLWGVALSVTPLAHEGLILFLPVAVAMVWLSNFSRTRKAIFAFSIACVGSWVVYFDILTLPVATPETANLVCQPLLDRSLEHSICDGAIRWTEKGLADGRTLVANSMELKPILAFVAAYGVALTPFIITYLACDSGRHLAAITLLALCLFAPLYPFADDWGRWLSWHLTTTLLLMMVAHSSGKIRFVRPVRRQAVWSIIVLNLLITPRIVIGANGLLPSLIGL